MSVVVLLKHQYKVLLDSHRHKKTLLFSLHSRYSRVFLFSFIFLLCRLSLLLCLSPLSFSSIHHETLMVLKATRPPQRNSDGIQSHDMTTPQGQRRATTSRQTTMILMKGYHHDTCSFLIRRFNP